MAAGFVLHSVLCEGPTVQVSYHDPANVTPHGFTIVTEVITMSPDLEVELGEVNDAALQLVTAWAGLMRETRPGGLPGR